MCESPMHISLRMRLQRRSARGRVGGTPSDTCVHCLGRASCFFLAACLPRHVYVTHAPACQIWGRLRAWLVRERNSRPGGSGGKPELGRRWRAPVHSVIRARCRRPPCMHIIGVCLWLDTMSRQLCSRVSFPGARGVHTGWGVDGQLYHRWKCRFHEDAVAQARARQPPQLVPQRRRFQHLWAPEVHPLLGLGVHAAEGGGQVSHHRGLDTCPHAGSARCPTLDAASLLPLKLYGEAPSCGKQLQETH